MNKYQIATVALIAGFIVLSSFQIDKPYVSCLGRVDDCPGGTEEYLSTMSALGTVFPTRTKFPTSTDAPTPTEFVYTLSAPKELPLLKSSSPEVKQTFRQIIQNDVGYHMWAWFNNDIATFRFQNISYVDLKKRTLYSARNLYAPGVQQDFIDSLSKDGHGKVNMIFRSPSGNRMLIYRNSQINNSNEEISGMEDVWLWEKGNGFSVLFTGNFSILNPEIIPETATWSADENIFYVRYWYLAPRYIDSLIYIKDKKQRGIFVIDREKMSLINNLGNIMPKNFVISGDRRLAAFDLYDENNKTSDIIVIAMDELDKYFYTYNSLPPRLDSIRRNSFKKMNPKYEWANFVTMYKPITWSPDNSSIFFPDKTDDGIWAIIKYDLRSKSRSIWMKFSDFEALQGGPILRISPPDFSPDGKHFILVVDNKTLIFEESNK